MAFGSWEGGGDWDGRLRWVVGHLDECVHVVNKAHPPKGGSTVGEPAMIEWLIEEVTQRCS